MDITDVFGVIGINDGVMQVEDTILELPQDSHLFTGRLSLADHRWLAGHVVFESVLLPGTAFVEMALAAADRVGLDSVEELTLEAPLRLPRKGAVQCQLPVGPTDESGRSSDSGA